MIPENEQGVIVLFAEQAKDHGFEIVRIGARFPDATVRKEAVEFRVEFEHMASNFKQHQHNVSECDIIICWENNWPDCILPVLALSRPDWSQTDLALPSEAERAIWYWKNRALTAEGRLKDQSSGLVEQEVDGPASVLGAFRSASAGRNSGGRPVTQLRNKSLAYYLWQGSNNVTARQSRDELGLRRDVHERYVANAAEIEDEIRALISKVQETGNDRQENAAN